MTTAKNVPKFSILLPVHRAPTFLPYAIKSVLAQTERDFELFIVCDGAPAATITCANEFANADPRIKVLAFEKGQRTGEAHRHTALQLATGEFVAHIQDDDLWLPNHLNELEKLLQEFEFGNLLHVFINENKKLDFFPGDLASVETFSRLLNSKFNIFGLSVAGYRLRAYHSLPIGWSPAPEDMWPDLNMWRKFLNKEGLKFGSRVAITVLKFPAYFRSQPQQDSDLIAEIDKWCQEIKSPAFCEKISQEILKQLSQRAFNYSWQLIEANTQLQNLQQEYTVMQADLQNMRAEITAKDEAVALANSLHAEEILQKTCLQTEIQNIYNTLSWKITAPLRAIKAGALKLVH